MSVELRTFTFLDILQPQFACFVASTSKGYLPVKDQAALYVEVAPGMHIDKVLDRALKSADVRPGVLIVEREFGLLEIHDFDQGAVRAAGAAILESMGLREQDRLKPRIVSTQSITGLDDYQAMLINRGRGGSMILPGQTLYILEVHPAGYAALACNQAEKAASITIVDVRPWGAFGRLWLAGSEADIAEASAAVVSSLEAVDGRKNEGGRRD